MKITIKAKDGENLCLTVSPSDSVIELKTKIHEKEKLLNQQQHLIYDGESLNDEHSLSDYKIQEGSILLMVNKERSLLLKSSIIFDNSSLLDRIHQSNIDLKNEPQEEDVLNLLNEAISYFDEDLKPNVAVELFFLISNCFMQYPDQCFKLFNKRFQKGKITANHIIAFAEVLSDLAIDLPNVSIKDHEDFINNSFQQIQKSTDDTLTIFGNEIPQHFKNIFISDIILLLEPTDKIVLKFSQNIINEENSATKVNYFIRNVGKCGLIKLIPDSLFIENSYYKNLTFENKTLLLQLSTEQTFRKFLPFIISDSYDNNKSSLFCQTVLNKLINFDISLYERCIPELLMAIDKINLSQKNIKYLEKHHIKLPSKLAPKILPKSPIYLKLFMNPKELPEDYISYALMEANELNIYKEVLKSDYLDSPVLLTIDFWKHIMNVIFHSDEELDNDLISRFTFYFQNYINPQQFDSFYDHLIFDEDSLPNEKQSLFLLKLLENMKHTYLHFTKDRLMKFFMKKEIPCKTLCSLFTFHEYPMKDPTSVELYIFVYSNNRDKYTIPLIFDISYEPILSKVYSTFKYYINKVLSYGTNENNDPNEILTQFIKQNNDISLIKDFTEKIFKFIAASLFYAGENRPFDVKGLTKENALPFYAIALNHIDEKREKFFDLSGQSFFKWSSKEMLDALIESIKCLENCNSALLNESINAILSKGPRLLIYDCIQLKTIFDILCDFCIKGSYQADKIQFINIVFSFSCADPKYLSMKPYILIIQKYGIHLFNFILQHKAELINAKRIAILNLSIFNIDEIKNSFENEIKKSTSDVDLYQTIFFYAGCCSEYPPILKVDKVTNINRIFEQFVEEEKWDDFYIITLFMLYNQIDVNFETIKEKKILFNVFTKLMQIPNYINIDNYLFQILSNPELENNLDIMTCLFDFIIQDDSVIYEYITANIDALSPNMQISYKMILQLKPHLYSFFKDILISVLKNSYDFDQETKQFIKKINVKLPEKFSKTDCSIIEKLYETKSYQSFICLHFIASCFPFLFDPDTSSNNKSHYIKAVDIVLPALNCLSFIYDDQNTEDKTNNLKAAIAALSFLYSCLNSTKFISVFILWLFENITSLTESQIIFMSTILHLLLNNEAIRIFILGYSIKYNFLDIMNDLLLRDIPNKEFKSFYIHTLYNLLYDYLSLISSSFQNEHILFIDGIKNGSISNPFELWFNYSSVTPVYIKDLEFTFPRKNGFNELIKEFNSKINSILFLWISSESNKELDENEISDFLSFFKDDEKSTFIKEKLPFIPSKKTIRTQRYLISHPIWADHFINRINQFPITLEHYEYLTKLVNKLNEINDEHKDNSTEEDAEVLDNYNLYDWFNNQICPIKLFRTVLDNHLYSEKIDDISTTLLDFLSSNSKYRKYLHQLVNETLLQIETKFSLKPRVFYYRILHIFAILVGKNRDNDEYIFQGGGNKFFEYFLSPFNLKLVSYTAKYLSILNCELPIQSTHIIGYIYAFNPSTISLALDLLSKLDEEKVKNIIPIIKNEYTGRSILNRNFFIVEQLI